MKFKEGEGIKKPTLYAIPQKDFEKNPKRLTPYKVGDKVTRDNFINFFIQSFAVSRGRLAVQIMFFRWLKEKYSFDYQKTLQAFSEAGGLENLTKEEQDQFNNAYDAVSRHNFHASMAGADMKDPKERKREFGINISKVIYEDVDNKELKSAEVIFDIKNLKSLTDFYQAAQKYFDANPPQNFSDQFAL